MRNFSTLRDRRGHGSKLFWIKVPMLYYWFTYYSGGITSHFKNREWKSTVNVANGHDSKFINHRKK
jgi:hypothetical protein